MRWTFSRQTLCASDGREVLQFWTEKPHTHSSSSNASKSYGIKQTVIYLYKFMSRYQRARRIISVGP